MTSSGKIYPYYVIDVAAWTIERIFWSDKLLIALNEKLERLKFTIVFMIADKNQRMQKLSNRMFIHPSFTPVLSFALAKFSFILGWTIHLVKKHFWKQHIVRCGHLFST